MLATSRTFEANARAGLANDNLQRALALMRSGFPERRRLAVDRLPEFEALREIGKSIKDHTLEHLDFYLELYEENVVASGGQVHWARTPEEARAAVVADLPLGRRQDRHQGQVDDRRGGRAQRIPRRERHHPGRDRSRRIHHPAAPRAAEPFDRAGDPSDEGAGRRDLPRRASRARPEAVARRGAPAVRRGARGAAAAVSCRRCRHHRRQFPGRRDRVEHHRDQRGQRRSDPDPAARPHRYDEPRKARADARGRGDIAASAGALGHRSGVLVLYDGVDRPAAAGRSRRSGAIPCRAARQRPQRAARQRVPGHAPLHPLLGVHEPLPGLRRGRRSRLWLGLFRPDGGGADAEPDRRRAKPATCRTPRPSAGGAKRYVRSRSRCRR